MLDASSRTGPERTAGSSDELLNEFGCHRQIASKGTPAPLQATGRWSLARTNSWHNQGFRKLAICTEVRTIVIDASIALANAIIIVRRLIREGWTRYRLMGVARRIGQSAVKCATYRRCHGVSTARGLQYSRTNFTALSAGTPSSTAIHASAVPVRP